MHLHLKCVMILLFAQIVIKYVMPFMILGLILSWNCTKLVRMVSIMLSIEQK